MTMTEIKADLYQETILNRKNFAKKNTANDLERCIDGIARRQNILLSVHADSLSDAELIQHKKEFRRRKLFSFFSFFIIPGALYYFKFSTRAIMLSLIPSLGFSQFIYENQLLSSKCNLSYKLSENSQNRFLEKILFFNNKRFSTSDDLLYPNRNGIPLKDWMARNEYR